MQSKRIANLSDLKHRVTDATVALEPDHPLLFRPPDAFLARPGELVAFFLPTAAETRRPEEVLAALAVARMALPPVATFVLIVEADSPIRVQSIFKNSFDEILPNSSEEIVSFSKRRRTPKRPTTRVHERWRSEWSKRFHNRLAIADEVVPRTTEHRSVSSLPSKFPDEFADGRREFTSEGWFSPDESRRHFRARTNVIVNKDVVIAASRRGSPYQRLKENCSAALQWRCTLDNGVPYDRAELPVVGVTPQRYSSRVDPGWPRRVVAFAGAVPMPEGEMLETWQALIERVSRLPEDL